MLVLKAHVHSSKGKQGFQAHSIQGSHLICKLLSGITDTMESRGYEQQADLKSIITILIVDNFEMLYVKQRMLQCNAVLSRGVITCVNVHHQLVHIQPHTCTLLMTCSFLFHFQVILFHSHWITELS